MLELVAVREGGTVADALAISLRTARHAESLGFARYWLAELQCLLAPATQADEFMLVCDIFDPSLRLRSLDIAAAAISA